VASSLMTGTAWPSINRDRDRYRYRDRYRDRYREGRCPAAGYLRRREEER
jgi:hypothetical protein